jgi:predicted PurR-regulated permease PerM
MKQSASTTTAAAIPSVLILAFMTSLGPFGDTEYTPSLPSIAHALSIGYGQAQLSMTVYLAGFALSQVLYGPLSDRFGVGLALCGVQFAMVFGLFAFLLNFVPLAGPLVASLAPWPIVLLSPDLSLPATVIGFLLPGTLFFIIGNFVEPKVLGRSVELQPLAVLLPLMFWGVLWGPMGILLATPVTGILALLASYSPLTEPIATVLSGKPSGGGPGQRSGAS